MPVNRATFLAKRISALIVLTSLSCVYLRVRLTTPNTPLVKLATQLTSANGRPAQAPIHMSVGLPLQGPTTKSYWLQEGANPLAREGADSPFVHQNVDIVVIGSGITGVSAVHHLVQGMKKERLGHLRVVVLEARDFCSGATGRNGGHFITLPYEDFTSRSARTLKGRDEGVLAAELEIRTIKLIRSLIATHGWEDDVHVEKNGHTRLFYTEEEQEEDLVEYNAAKSAGVPWDGISRLTKEEMIEKYGATYPGVSIPAGSIWSVKLVTKLFQLAVSDAQTASVSLQLHTHTPVEAIDRLPPTPQPHAARWMVRTSRGNLKTRFVIHATNAWTSHLLPQFAMPQKTNESSTEEKGVHLYGTWVAPYRGQIIATRASVPPSKLPRRAFAADWMEDYWLPEPVHGTPDESKNTLIILGGGRDSDENATELGVSDDTALNPRLSESLRTTLPKVFPQFFDKDKEPEFEWTGIMGFTDTGDPIVGPVPDPSGSEGQFVPGQFIAAGYNGHGMSRAYSCAEAVVQMIFEEMRTKERPPCFVCPDWLPKSFTTLRRACPERHDELN